MRVILSILAVLLLVGCSQDTVEQYLGSYKNTENIENVEGVQPSSIQNVDILEMPVASNEYEYMPEMWDYVYELKYVEVVEYGGTEEVEVGFISEGKIQKVRGGHSSVFLPDYEIHILTNPEQKPYLVDDGTLHIFKQPTESYKTSIDIEDSLEEDDSDDISH